MNEPRIRLDKTHSSYSAQGGLCKERGFRDERSHNFLLAQRMVSFVSNICGNSTGALKAMSFVVHFSAYICFVAGSANLGSHAGTGLMLILPDEKLRMYFYSYILVLSSLKFIKLF